MNDVYARRLVAAAERMVALTEKMAKDIEKLANPMAVLTTDVCTCGHDWITHMHGCGECCGLLGRAGCGCSEFTAP